MENAIFKSCQFSNTSIKKNLKLNIVILLNIKLKMQFNKFYH